MAISLAVAGAAVAACAAATGLPEPSPATNPLPAGTLRIELAFDAAVDLDLYVTGPQLETVYYGNTPSKIGGELAQDIRCDSPPGPRIETVTFPAAPSGHYRIGVDFQERCTFATGVAAYRIRVLGGTTREVAGEIEFGRFEVRALDFDHVAP